MKTISKLLIATAIVASAAAPSFAAVDHTSELQANSPAMTMPSQSGAGAMAYASTNDSWVRQPSREASGFDQINGGM